MRSTRIFLLLAAVGLSAVSQDRTAIVAASFDRFGGYRSIQRKATGFFRVEQVNRKWAFITPEGHPYLAIGANHVGKFLNDPKDSSALLARFGGDREKAVESIVAAMRDVNLTAGEAYGPLLDDLKPHFPYMEYVPFPDNQKWRFDVFDPAFRRRLEEHVRSQCEAFANNPMVLGVGFADLPVWNGERMHFMRSLPPEAAGKKRWVSWLRSRYRSIAALNAAYGTTFEKFASIGSSPERLPESPASLKDDEVFLGVMADSLYSLLRRATKAGAPRHLFFGEKFVARLYPDPVIRAVGKHVDVFLTQALILSPQRPPEWQEFQPDAYRKDHALTGGKPIIVVDWAPPFSLDETYATERGEVRDEKTASDQAAAWLSQAFHEDYMVGVFWCQMIGSHGNDRWFPKGRMKRTLVRDDATPFAYRTSRIRQVHREIIDREYRRLE